MPEFQLDKGGDVGFSNGPFYWHNLDVFTQGYIEAMFFTWPEDQGEYIGGITSPGFSDISTGTLIDIINDCSAFQEQACSLLEQAYATPIYDKVQAGRDFWFTRNGHGVGFWDRGLPGTLGNDLGNMCGWRSKNFPELDAHLGDDGKVYLT